MDRVEFELKPVREKPPARQGMLESYYAGAHARVMEGGGRRFIESISFPIQRVNEASVKEKGGGGRPPYWEMVFWWTRKPLFSARALIAGALLPEMPDPGVFLRHLGARFKGGSLSNVPHNINPRIPPTWKPYFEGKTLLDPFACFGSIPLEAMRLGLSKVVAADFLPVAYIFLRAVLEYPAKYGSELVRDVERWGGWVAERLKADPDIMELYDEDVAVYIGTWEVKCPNCGGYTPLVGNWWLARVGNDRGKWEALAWMKPRVGENGVNIEIIDLKELYGDLTKASVDTHQRRVGKSQLSSYTIKVGGDEWRVDEPNIATGANYARCLLCGNPIIADEEMISMLTDSVDKLFKEFNVHVSPSRSLILALLQKGVKKALEEFLTSSPEIKQAFIGKKTRILKALGELMKKEIEERWYVKKILNEWNRKLEEYLEGKLSLDELKEATARSRLLVKVKMKGRDLIFGLITKEDDERLWIALEKLRKIWEDPDIPKELFAPYGFAYGGQLSIPIWGFNKFYKLFNPCQLLTLVKLVKLIREIGKLVEEEKLKQSWNREEAFKYAEVLTTYLTIALCKYADYNSMETRWRPDLLRFEATFAQRGITIIWNWCDAYPFMNIPNASGSWLKVLNNLVNGLRYLIFAISDSPTEIMVLFDDATTMRGVHSDQRFDLIVTDPPYRYDIMYTELSDFYYIWLKRGLSDSEKGGLKPRFYIEPFSCFFRDGRELRAQWEEYRFKEVSLNPFRLGESASIEDGLRHYQSLMSQAFLTMYERLKDDGILVTYFAHTHPDAWAELIEAGWRFAGFTVTNAFPIATESAQSVVKRGKLSLDTSIAVVWRKAEEPRAKADIREIRDLMLQEGIEWSEKVLGRYYGRDLFFTTFAKILSIATRYGKLTDMMGELDAQRLVKEYVTPQTGRALVSTISGEPSGGVTITDPLAQLYLLIKILFAVRDGGGGTPRRKILGSNDIVLLTLATGMDKKEPIESMLLEKSKNDDSEYVLLDPMTDKAEDLEKLLRKRGIDPVSLEVEERSASAVDLLHMMEYIAKSRAEPHRVLEELRAKHPSEYSTATALARALVRALPEGDVEKGLCRSLLYITGV